VNKASSRKPDVDAFVKFYLKNAVKIVEHPNVGYVSLSEDLYGMILSRYEKGVTGSAMAEAEAGKPADLVALYGQPAPSTQDGG
jgi:hypothetical protein